MTPSPPNRVGAVYEAVRRRLARRLVATMLGAVGSILLVVLLLAWLFSAPEGWTRGNSAPLILDVLASASLGGLYLLYRWLTGEWLGEFRVAKSIDGAAHLPEGTVGGALELAKAAPPGTSASLAWRAHNDVAAELDRGVRQSGVRQLTGQLGIGVDSWLGRSIRLLLILGLLLGGLTLLSPRRTQVALAGVISPIEVLRGPLLPALQIRPGDAQIPRGQPLQVEVDAQGRTEVTLRWQATGEVLQEQRSATSLGQASFLLPPILAPTEYWIETPDGARSDIYTVVPVDPLFISRLALEVEYPAYTGIPSEEYRDPIPPLQLPRGSRVSISGQATRDLEAASLKGEMVPSGAAVGEVRLTVAGPVFEAEWTPTQSGVFQWEFTGLDGNSAEMIPGPVDLTLLDDGAPVVTLLTPDADAVLPISLKQPLVIEARDDYGLLELELIAYRATALGDRSEPMRQQLGLGGAPGIVARPVLDVSGWSLLPGDTIRYWAQVVDNSPAGQVGRTPEYVLRMPSTAELRQEAQGGLEETADDLQSLVEDAAQVQEEARNLQRQQANERRGEQGDQLSFEQREDVQQAMERQDELIQNVDSLSSNLEELAQSLEEAGMADPDLQQKLQELEDLLRDISTPELEEQMRRLAESLEGRGEEEISEALRNMTEGQAEFRERLEEALEQFRRAAVEQDFRATTAEAEELAQQEDALADAFREGDDPELRIEQQQDLQDRSEDLDERMQALQDRLTELGENETRQQVQDAQERMQQAQQAMSQAGQQAQQGNMSQAGEQAEQASQEMSEVAQELAQAQQEMMQRMQEAQRRALTQAANDALELARRQADLREEMRTGGQDGLSELQADESALLQGVQNLAQNLALANQMNQSGGDRDLLTRAGEAMMSLQEAIDALEGANNGRSPAALRASEEAIDALNQLALGAMNRAQDGGESDASSAEQLMEQMQQLAEQQGQLNNQTGSIVPMQLGQEAMSNQLQDVAVAQQAVASDLGDLAQQQQSGQEQVLGDLEAMAQEAMELVQRLAGGRLDQETRERQERLFHRLLDAGRSLEKEEFSDERESEAPETFDSREVRPLTAEEMGVFRFPLPTGTQMQSLSPAQRQLILKYFERLNRVGSGGGGS